MKVIVDTNVPVVANGEASHASPTCVIASVHKLRDIQVHHTLVLDDGWHILKEYMANLRFFNAVDRDWYDYRHALEQHGVQIEFLCPDMVG